MASTGFRWNVSGTYMQAIPRLISTSPAWGDNGDRANAHAERGAEFLRDYFPSAGEMTSRLFLKGYQWPFDARKAAGGSSLIDILVYVESVVKGRHVYLDFRTNPSGFSFSELTPEAREYLTRSQALLPTPLERLRAMNPGAIELYAEHGIELARQPLEIAVCAQHNNGGLAGDLWWQSTNVAHLFPVGEVNGSHGVYRPGGSALNAGQVGAFRAAEYIAARCAHWTLSKDKAQDTAQEAANELQDWLARCSAASSSWQTERGALQERMTRAGAHIRSPSVLEAAVEEAWSQWESLRRHGCTYTRPEQAAEPLRTLQLCLAHAVYLDAIAHAVRSGVGSRGSAIVLDPRGTPLHEALGQEWRIAPENPAFREQVLETTVSGALADERPQVSHRWVSRRPIPEADAWFETAWARYREGKIFGD
jgi:succinate dehydrogenase/fumarate reductase flavoprotein subunit